MLNKWMLFRIRFDLRLVRLQQAKHWKTKFEHREADNNQEPADCDFDLPAALLRYVRHLRRSGNPAFATRQVGHLGWLGMFTFVVGKGFRK